MGVVIKQSFWTTFLSYLGIAIAYFNTLYLRAEHFDLAQIGIFTLITANAMMVSSFSSLGTGSIYIRYFPHFNKEEKNKLFTVLFLVALLSNLVLLFIGYHLKEWIALRYKSTAPNYQDYFWVIGIIILANSLFSLFFNLSKAHLKVIFPTFLREIYLRAGVLLLVFGFSVSWWSFDGAVLGLGVLYTFAFILLFLHLTFSRYYRFDFRFRELIKQWIGKAARFGGYSMLFAGTFAIVNNISYDQLTAEVGPAAAGIFQTCFFIAVIVEMPWMNMAKVISPILSQEFQKGNMKEIESLYKRTSITQSTIGLLLLIGIISNVGNLFDFIPKGEFFREGFWVVVCVCAAKLYSMTFGMASAIINFSNYYRYNLYFQLFAVVLIVTLNICLVPIYGLNGAAISYLITRVLEISLQVLFTKMHFKIQPLTLAHLKLFAIGGILTFGAILFQPALHPIVLILLRSILTTLLFVALVYQLRISRDINQLINSTFERFLKIKI